MGNFPFAIRSIVWPRRLNSGVKHDGKRFDSGVRPADEKVQLGGNRVCAGGLNDTVHLMAIFAIKPRAVSDARGRQACERVRTRGEFERCQFDIQRAVQSDLSRIESLRSSLQIHLCQYMKLLGQE
jgi:hypothetical protein